MLILIIFFCRYVINTFLVLSQLGFCCVYFLFVATNLQDVGNYYYKQIDVRFYLAILLIPLILLNFLKNLKILAPVSLFASILTVISEYISNKVVFLLFCTFFFIFYLFVDVFIHFRPYNCILLYFT